MPRYKQGGEKGGGGNPWEVLSSLPPASQLAQSANKTAVVIAQSAVSTAAATALAAICPFAAPLAGWLASWDDLGEFLGGLFPTKQPDLPATQRWGDIWEKAGSRPGIGDFALKRGEIVFDVNSGFPVGRWSYSRQRILPVLGFDAWGYCVFIDPEKGATHEAEAMALVEATTPPPSNKRAPRQELTSQYINIAKPAAMAGYFAPGIILAMAEQAYRQSRGRGEGAGGLPPAARGLGKAAAIVAGGALLKKILGF